MSNLFNLEYEQNLIGAIIQWPDIYSEIGFLSYKDFSKTNSPIWQVIENTITNKGSPTPVILAEKLKSIGITLDGLENYDYLESLRIRPIDKKGVVHIAKELKKLTLVRTTYERAVKLQQEVVKLKDGPAKDILKCIDDNLGKSLTMLGAQDNEAINLYERLPDYIEELGNNPVDDIGFIMPYPKWQEMYGGLRPANIYCVASRSGQGKSTWLMETSRKIVTECNPTKNISLLYLDTEMREEDQMIRMAAAKVGCPYWLLDTGNWRKSPEWFPKVRKELNEIRANAKKNLWFKQIGSMDTPDLVSFVKRWYYNKVGRGNDALICYDYFKLNTSSTDKKEWTLALEKAQILKDLVDEINAPLLTAVQVNRSGTTTNRDAGAITDDDSVISISDRLQWLLASIGILRRKSPDEIAHDGKDWGTHKYVHLKGRFQGRASQGHHDLVKMVAKINGKETTIYKNNYINFNIDNFSVEEKSTFKDWAELHGKTKIPLKDNKQDGLL